MKVAILGSTGMLGHTVSKFLSANKKIELVPTSRTKSQESYFLDVTSEKDLDIFLNDGKFDYVINCIGIIKPHIKERDSKSIANAIQINGIFPHLLAAKAQEFGSKVIQIATDCVFSGNNDVPYSEISEHDALDVYGKTKSLGEVISENFLNLRVSIIGPEQNTQSSLLEWFLSQRNYAQINGFINHFWNGVSTFHFAKCIEGIIEKDIFKPGAFHLVPNNTVSKFELLGLIGSIYGRTDIVISPHESKFKVNRILSTLNSEYNHEIWRSAGYAEPPTIKRMIEELRNWTNC